MNAKTCKQCGELKPIEQYRAYYGGRRGTYTICRLCERINSRHKYLKAKGESIGYDEEAEIQQIEDLWEAQHAIGLQPPRLDTGRRTPMPIDLVAEAAKYRQLAGAIQHNNKEAPFDLNQWLTKDLTEDPEYYQDTIYEALKKKYRPQLAIDTDTLMPVYDDTYKEVLDAILTRFDTYEDEYYNK